jgi:hypothetical protein
MTTFQFGNLKGVTETLLQLVHQYALPCFGEAETKETAVTCALNIARRAAVDKLMGAQLVDVVFFLTRMAVSDTDFFTRFRVLRQAFIFDLEDIRRNISASCAYLQSFISANVLNGTFISFDLVV